MRGEEPILGDDEDQDLHRGRPNGWAGLFVETGAVAELSVEEKDNGDRLG
jgi:ribonucleotide monophosphatase NagD (HAD superfamily)